ncbi:MAG: ribonuclease J [Proteobacteria bacterium]|nr:ribonuclease J [Pseudomonadota bacterium]
MTRDTGELLFLPLGGAGEIGMNLNLYCCDDQWLMVDLGITFADEQLPGIDVILPDPAFIVERRDQLVGLVLTHAHEDHLGAVVYLWSRLRCPVYATPFTAAVLRRKIARDGHTYGATEMAIHELPLGARFTLGPFDIEYIALTHSILEPNALAIRTPLGLVLHTGDWKLDPDPVIGEITDEEAFKALGREGVLAMICDSTNVLRDGESGSEAALLEPLSAIIGGATGLVAVGCFASNVARIETICRAAEANGRQVALIGPSLWRITEAARETGYLEDVPAFLDARDAGHLPDDKLLYICTGSQGEPRAALSRISESDHPQLTLGKGDMVIFSSKIIPGNELAINRLHNRLIALGVEVITEDDHFIHVSGHPCRDELSRMYGWVKPEISVPVHGEARHLVEHVEFARSLQVGQAVLVQNGALVRLAPGPAEVVDHVQSGRLIIDGNALVSADSPTVQERRRLMWNGVAFVTLVIDEEGSLLADPKITAQGLFHPDQSKDEAQAVLAGAAADIRQAMAGAPSGDINDDGKIRDIARIAVRRRLKGSHDKRPVVEIQIVRL